MARRPSTQINLAAIAQRLDISISTASRALRNADEIHPETRRRVLDAAGELGYVMPGLPGQDSTGSSAPGVGHAGGYG